MNSGNGEGPLRTPVQLLGETIEKYAELRGRIYALEVMLVRIIETTHDAKQLDSFRAGCTDPERGGDIEGELLSNVVDARAPCTM